MGLAHEAAEGSCTAGTAARRHRAHLDLHHLSTSGDYAGLI